MIQPGAAALITASTLFFVAALSMGNLAVLSLGLVPLLFLAISHGARPPRRLRMERTMPPSPWNLASAIPVEITISMPGARGVLEIHQPLPDAFELVDGSNLYVVRKGLRSAVRYRFSVRCAKRGTYQWPSVAWSVSSPTGLTQGASGTVGDEVEVRVKAVAPSYKKMISARGRAVRIFPEADRSRIGIQTNEFRDLRQYVRGDSPRAINWKATASVQSRLGPDAVPLVNEYEVEGKKRVWLFLDAGPCMRVGTTVENAFEHAIQATLGTARYFIDRGFRVGFSLFNHPRDVFLYPEMGGRQFMRIQDQIHDLEPADGGAELTAVAARARAFLRGGRSLVIVVTRAERADSLVEGLRRLRSLVRASRTIPLFVLSPDPYSLVPDRHDASEGARLVMRRLDAPGLERVRKLGVQVLRWDPRTTPFQAVLVRRLAAR